MANISDLRAKILIVDDDKELSFIIKKMLESYSYSVTVTYTCQDAFDLLAQTPYDLVLLDVNLPDGTGFDVCRQLRSACSVPVIFASARTSEDDRVTGFDIGGDDYLPKPYSMRELLSRVNALLRRTFKNSTEEKIVTFGSVRVNITARTVEKGGKPVTLSLREFDLLAYLCENKNAAVSKEKIFSAVWGAFTEVEPSTLAVHIRWLREKLEDDPAEPKYIRTVRKVGYVLEVTDR
jgi:two-component system response regulator VicR